jgi:ABC-type dipeptide/oligopeptide/nickel transport system permease subunit
MNTRVSPRLWAGLVLVGLVLLTAILAVQLAPYPANAIDTSARLQGPSARHLVGTDQFGRDILSRVLVGTRVSMIVAVTAIAVGLSVGVLIGLLAAFYGRVFDLLVTGILDVLYAFPAVLLAIAVIAAFGVGIVVTSAAIGVIFIPYFARLARATARTVLQMPYIDVARTIGMSDRRILLSEVLPNIASPLVSQAAVAMAFAIVTEAALSFLGLGAQPPDPSWGNMINDGRGFMQLSPWLAIAPGAAIFVASLAFNLLGDGLRDYWDPGRR